MDPPNPAANEPLDVPIIRQDEERHKAAPRRSMPGVILRFIFLATVYTAVYSWFYAKVVTISYTGVHWVFQVIASHWNWLDPSGMFEAIAPSRSMSIVNSSAYLIYFPRAVVMVLPTLFFLREWDSAPPGQKMGPVKRWWARMTAPIPRVILSILDVALIFSVGPIGACLDGTRWLDVKHATMVAFVVSAFHAMLPVLVKWPSRRQAIRLGDDGSREAEDMEKGFGGVVSPEEGTPTNANKHDSPRKPCKILLMTVLVTIPLTTIAMAYYTASAYFLAHYLLCVAAPRWLDPEVFQTVSPQNTMSTARLGAFFVLTPRIVIGILPILFTLNECAATYSIKPVGRWWARKTKSIPPVALSVLDKSLVVAAGPVGIWLRQFWPAGEPGMSAWSITTVAVVASVCTIVWEAAMRKVFPAETLSQARAAVEEKDSKVEIMETGSGVLHSSNGGT